MYIIFSDRAEEIYTQFGFICIAFILLFIFINITGRIIEWLANGSLKKLFCKHRWKIDDIYTNLGDMYETIQVECIDCGKKKTIAIRGLYDFIEKYISGNEEILRQG